MPAMTTPNPPAAEPTGTRKPKRWLWIAAAVAVVLAASGTAYAFTGGEDSGVEACERSAERAANGTTADSSSEREVQMLLDSGHADLREVGAALERAKDGDLSDVMRVGVQMMAACARHGVVIDPTS